MVGLVDAAAGYVEDNTDVAEAADAEETDAK